MPLATLELRERIGRICVQRDQAGEVAERNLLSGIGDREGGVGHGEVGWVGVWGEGGVRIWANEVWAGDFGSFRVIGGEKGRLADRVF